MSKFEPAENAENKKEIDHTRCVSEEGESALKCFDERGGGNKGRGAR